MVFVQAVIANLITGWSRQLESQQLWDGQLYTLFVYKCVYTMIDVVDTKTMNNGSLSFHYIVTHKELL